MANCSNCGSPNISFKRENVGEVRGKRAKQVVHRTVGFCKDCGYTWVASVDDVPRQRKTWLWVLGWLIIFPLPLTILLLRKQNMKPAVKYAIIGVAWVFYLIIAFGGSSKKGEDATVPETNTITVEIQVTPKVNSEDGSVLFGINTNLPVDTQFLVTVSDGGDYTAQDKTVILKDGNGYTSEFSNHGEALKGKYHVEVTTGIARLQPDTVKAVIGEHGEKLAGEYVEKEEITGDNLVCAEFDFEF